MPPASEAAQVATHIQEDGQSGPANLTPLLPHGFPERLLRTFTKASDGPFHVPFLDKDAHPRLEINLNVPAGDVTV